MADTQPEADVYNGPGGWWPGTGYGQTAPAARRLNQYFLGVAWCLVPAGAGWGWCLVSQVCQYVPAPVQASLYIALAWPLFCCNLLHLPII